MATSKKKIYAVRKGRTIGLFETWEECKEAVTGVAGAEYKGFLSRQEAYEYLGMGKDILEETAKKKEIETKNAPLEIPAQEDKIIAYVDGSYEHSLLKYAFGCVFLLPDGRRLTENGSGNNPESAKLRNVTGEMLGAMFAVQFAIKNGYPKIEICYDYEGVEKWVTGVWKSKTELTQKYAQAMRSWGTKVQISFTKVAAHTNVYYNEMADQLAKAALVEKDGIPKVRMADEMEELSDSIK